jgi:hypothetical protein
MSKIRILLQTTIPFAEDDWHIGRFSLLAQELDRAAPNIEVVARDRGRRSHPILACSMT